MRLLNTSTFVIIDFYGDIPPYAILSHTWGEEEVTFQDVLEGRAPTLKGYNKIAGCCRQAVSDGLDYVWIDTCCIDKSSSAELTEAINSMFSWYRDASICYAYLQDCESDEDPTSFPSNFTESRWFTRGWTLQELLAPSIVVFFGSNWSPVGTREQLSETIAIVTRIDRLFFAHGKLSSFSVAQKMSWASRRQTTRVEDQAYCLLGLFDVSMPLLYGEGPRAFMRLQEEIMKGSDDQSIFAWASTEHSQGAVANFLAAESSAEDGGLLAPSPAQFASSGDIVAIPQDLKTPPYAITNKGIQISLPVIDTAASGYSVPFIPYAGTRYDGNSSDNGAAADEIHFALSPTGSLAVLSCQSRREARTRTAIVIDRGDPDEPFARTDLALGLISIPAADVQSRAQVQHCLIRARNTSKEGFFWSNTKRGRLVVVQPLPARAASAFALARTRPVTPSWAAATGDGGGGGGGGGGGAVSFRMPLDAQGSQRPVALVFESPRDTPGGGGGAFCLIFRPSLDDTQASAFLVPNLRSNAPDSDIYPLLADDGAQLLAKDKDKVLVQRMPEESGGDLSLELELTQRSHATLVRIIDHGESTAAAAAAPPPKKKRRQMNSITGVPRIALNDEQMSG